MSKPPTVSVIIPTYNRAHLIGRAIRSVLAQSFQDFELVAVDDASTDTTEGVVNSFADPRIRYQRHDVNRGPGATRNTGIRAARGDFIAFLDSDDEWLPDKLKMQLDVFQRTDLPNLGVVNGGIILVDKRGERPIYPPMLRGNVFERVWALLGMPGTGSLLMIRRCVTDGGILFDETLPAFEDYEFFLQISREYQVDTILAPLDRKYEDDGGPHVWNTSNIINGHLRILEKFHQELQATPTVLIRTHMALAATYCLTDDIRAVRKHIRAAIEAGPRSLRGYVWLVATVFGCRAYRLLYYKLTADRKSERILIRLKGGWRTLRTRIGRTTNRAAQGYRD